jgi:hypothetical protein
LKDVDSGQKRRSVAAYACRAPGVHIQGPSGDQPACPLDYCTRSIDQRSRGSRIHRSGDSNVTYDRRFEDDTDARYN